MPTDTRVTYACSTLCHNLYEYIGLRSNSRDPYCPKDTSTYDVSYKRFPSHEHHRKSCFDSFDSLILLRIYAIAVDTCAFEDNIVLQIRQHARVERVQVRPRGRTFLFASAPVETEEGKDRRKRKERKKKRKKRRERVRLTRTIARGSRR